MSDTLKLLKVKDLIDFLKTLNPNASVMHGEEMNPYFQSTPSFCFITVKDWKRETKERAKSYVYTSKDGYKKECEDIDEQCKYCSDEDLLVLC